MKRTLQTLTLLALSTLAAWAGPKLAWNPVTTGPAFNLYRVYELTAPNTWTPLGTVPATGPTEFPVTIDGLPHVFGVTTANDFFESDFTTTNAPEKPNAPGGLQIIRVP